MGEVGCWDGDAGLLECQILNGTYGIRFNTVIFEALDRVLVILSSWIGKET